MRVSEFVFALKEVNYHSIVSPQGSSTVAPPKVASLFVILKLNSVMRIEECNDTFSQQHLDVA